MEEQTGTAQRFVASVLGIGARPERKGPQQQVERLTNRIGMSVRAEVLRSRPSLAPHHRGSGPFLCPGDGQEWVRLVVPQPDIESGLVLLDERVLEHQGFDLGFGNYPVNRFRCTDHRSSPDRQIP